MGENPLQKLDVETCKRLLNAHSIGRLALTKGNRIDIFSVRYVVHRGKIYFQTTSGDTFKDIVVTREVAFEIDEARSESVKQVSVYGTAHWYPYDVDIAPELLEEARVAETGVMDWVEIVPEKITGRELKLNLTH